MKDQIKESDDVGKSLSRDVKQTAKTKARPGYGDQGDQPRKFFGQKNNFKKGVCKKEITYIFKMPTQNGCGSLSFITLPGC